MGINPEFFPRSRATTAYELLAEICVLIREEPKRYNQKWVILVDETAQLLKIDVPRCGTVGCVAGWVVLLTEKAVPQELLRSSHGYISDATVLRARDVLGLHCDVSSQLFYAEALRAYLKEGEKLPREGTRAYARLGVKHIKSFMKKYETQLRAKQLEA